MSLRTMSHICVDLLLTIVDMPDILQFGDLAYRHMVTLGWLSQMAAMKRRKGFH